MKTELQTHLEEVFKAKCRQAPVLTTTRGNVPWSQADREVGAGAMQKVEGGHDTDKEVCAWVEYWKDGECIHRSAHVHLKQPTAGGSGKVQGFR